MTRTITTTGLAVACLVLLTACGSSPRSGQKNTDRLVKEVGTTAKSVEQTRGLVQTTLANYNAILSSEGDLSKSYNSLSKNVEKLQSQSEDLTKQIDKTRKAADKLFKDWEKSLAKIENQDLRADASGSMEAAKERIDKLITAVEEGNGVLVTFIASLNDQVTYLGYNLTPDGVASLQDQATALNADAEALAASMDAARDAAAAYKASVVTE